MYSKIIDEVKPKPKFNLKYYSEKGKYSDGDVENVIFNIVLENEPEDYVEAIRKNFNWAVYYHLTQVRKNLLNWYPFDEEASVLEIGCGMGAITNMLCDRCKDVTAVELSQRRAMTTLLRCRDRENLEIIVGNLNDIKFEKTYDYITLIGVLEYQGNYTDSDNPYVDFLKKIKKLLKPNGKLIIAIENQYGLKYWCGAREDHLGIPFEGINSYVHTQRGVRTFSKETLKDIIKEAGFKDTYFYYPLPDYKLPTTVFSEKYLPEQGKIGGLKYYYIPNAETLHIDERMVYDEIIKNNVFEFFANSFMVECGEGNLGDIIYTKLNSTREEEYQTGIRITAENKVERFGLNKERSQQHLENTVIYENKLINQGIDVIAAKKQNEILEYERCIDPTIEGTLVELYKNNSVKEIMEIWDMIYENILKSSPEVPSEDNIIYTFDLGLEVNKEKYGKILKFGYLDMIPQNGFCSKEGNVFKIKWFDQEWMLENLPANFIMYRSLWYFYYGDKEKDKVITYDSLCEKYGIFEALEEYKLLDNVFVSSVYNTDLVKQSNLFRGKPEEEVMKNLSKLINI